MPVLDWLPRYQRSWLTSDAVAGLSVWALLVPQGLAYAALAGVPVQFGLYTSFAALIAYAIFGTSRQLAQGPSATVAAVSAAVVAPIAGSAALGTSAFVPVTAALALVTGVVYVLLGILRMGWVSNFLSKAVLAGFILGFALGIIIDQSYKLFGVTKTEGTYVQKLIDTLKELPHTSVVTLAVGALSLAALLLMRRFLRRWPRALIVMALSILAVTAFDLMKHGVSITGNVPTGLFDVGVPHMPWDDILSLIAGAFSIVFVGFSETLASGRTMALKHRYDIDPNQELVAEGAACAAAGFVGGFASDGSLSKTSVADAAGQKTQMASLINALFILLTLLFLASIFENLPSATLGAVVIDSMVGLVDFNAVGRYFRVNRSDWVFSMGALLGILFLGIIQGVLIGVVMSLLALISRASKPAVRRLGWDKSSQAYLAEGDGAALETTPGVVVVRIDGPLFFADATRFRDELRQMIAGEPGLRTVVIDGEAVSQTDTDGADMVAQIGGELQRDGVVLALARVSSPVLELWRRAGAVEVIDDNVFPTVREAIERTRRDARITPSG